MTAHERLAGRLLGVAPRGLGTGESEALSGYVVRLAGVHVVSTRIFVRGSFRRPCAAPGSWRGNCSRAAAGYG